MLLSDATKTDPLSEARQGNIFDPVADTMSCFDEGQWTDRYMTEEGWPLGIGMLQTVPIKLLPPQKAGRVPRL